MEFLIIIYPIQQVYTNLDAKTRKTSKKSKRNYCCTAYHSQIIILNNNNNHFFISINTIQDIVLRTGIILPKKKPRAIKYSKWLILEVSIVIRNLEFFHYSRKRFFHAFVAMKVFIYIFFQIQKELSLPFYFINI